MKPGWFTGLATLDIVHAIERLPRTGEKAVASRTWVAAGGPAAGAAICFAALGGQAVLFTALGEGETADLIRADLAGAGVEVVDAALPGSRATCSTVLVTPDGERTVVSGSAQVNGPAEVSVPDLGGAAVLLIDGHLPALAVAAYRSAVADGTPVVIDAGSHKPVFDQLGPGTRDLICSADYRHPDGRGAEEFLAAGARMVAVSHGPGPLVWSMADASGTLYPPAVTAVDTLGAGDVLHGAYCHGLALGLEPVPALDRAARIASASVAVAGPLAWRAVVAQWE